MTRWMHNAARRADLVARLLAPLLPGIVLDAAQAAAPRTVEQRARRTPVVDVFERCRDAVVNISATRVTETQRGFGGIFDDIFEFSPRQSITRNLGSGFVVHRDGYIVTNAHVIARAVEVKVLFADKSEFDAERVAVDVEHDLAVLKVSAGHPLPDLPLGRSDDLMIGETVIAIGNPLGYQHTCTAGIVSALDRELVFPQGTRYRGLIQTDASINPGNSGGPLLNVNGELIGINTAIRGDAQNICFAIPVDALRRLLPEMLDLERVRRVRLGLHLSSETADAGVEGGRFTHGVVVARVDRGSSAARGGAKADDILLAINDRPTPTFLEAFSILDQTESGRPLKLTLARRGRIIDATMQIEAIPPPDGAKLMAEKFGIRVRNMTTRELRELGLRAPIGLVVLDVDPDTDAAGVGLERGDLITSVAGRPSRTTESIGHLLEALESGTRVLVGVARIYTDRLVTADLRLVVR